MYWRLLGDDELLAVYETAIKAQLNTEFIKMLAGELNKRKEMNSRKNGQRSQKLLSGK
jgi:hypothetical protein